MTLHEPAQGAQFGLEDAMVTFQPAIVASGILFACFLAVMLLSCFVSGSKKSKKDFMIDTRNLKTTFRHTPETIICPPSEIQNRARFSCARHGPWLLVVLVARLFYMFIFTFTFFYLVFQAINKPHYDTLGEYDYFAVGRDAQLVSYSKGIEVYYANETARMERELEKRNFQCHDRYRNLTTRRYVEGAKHVVEYHNEQMDNPLGNISINFTNVKNIFVQGDGQTACNIKPSSDPEKNDAIVWINSKDGQVYHVPQLTQAIVNDSSPTNETYTIIVAGNVTALVAADYDTSWSNFSEVESVLGPFCEQENWCYGWGFFNKDGSNPPFYVMLNELGDPSVEDGVSGICYGATKLDAELELLEFNASYFENYADRLNEQYLKDFQSYADDLYDTLHGLWGAIQDFPTEIPANQGSFKNKMVYDWKQNYSSGAGYSFKPIFDDIQQPEGSGSNNSLGWNFLFDLELSCPTCPQGDISNQSLQQIAQYHFDNSNLSEYTNLSELPVNFSNLVSINTAFIEFPDFPTIELPFDFDFPLDLSLIFNISLTLDLLLLVYRWYRTTGIVARIVRGKDVEVGLSYLMVSQSEQKCCYGRSVMDYCLNCIIYCHDKLFRLSYNAWKLFFWVWFLLKIAIVALIVLMLYYLVY
eukprot:459575_1